MEDDISSLRSWYIKQYHLPSITDKELSIFLHSCYGSLEQAKSTIENYFTCRSNCPEIFENRDPKKVDILNGKLITNIFMLPGTTLNGDRVLFIRLRITDPTYFDVGEQCKSFVMTCDLEHHIYGPSNGFIIVFDMTGIQFGHGLKANLMIIRKMLYYLQEGIPVRFRELHFINVVPGLTGFLTIIKPFIKNGLMDKLHLHSSDLTELNKVVQLSMLPCDYIGGESLPINDQSDAALELRLKHAAWFKELDAKARVDESKRPRAAEDSGRWGINGSFRKLQLD